MHTSQFHVCFVLLIFALPIFCDAQCTLDTGAACRLEGHAVLAPFSPYISWPVLAVAGTGLNFTVDVEVAGGCDECSIDTALLTADDYVVFVTTRRLSTVSPLTGSLFNVTNHTENSIVFVTSASVYLVFVTNNPLRTINVPYVIAIEPIEFRSCWEAVLFFGAPALLLLLLFIVLPIVLLVKHKDKERKRLDFGLAPNRAYLRMQSMQIPDEHVSAWKRARRRCRAWFKRLPRAYPAIPWKGPRLLSAVIARPESHLVQFLREWNSLIWPWYPAWDEVLPRQLRITLMVSTLVFQLMVQTVWSAWFLSLQISIFAGAGDFITTFFGRLLFKIITGAIATAIFGTVLQVVARLLYTWSWVRHPVSRSLRWFSRSVVVLFYAVLAGIAILLIIFTIRLMALYPCIVLLTDQLLPFLLAQLLASFIPAIPINMFLYVLFRTCGAPAPQPIAKLGTDGDSVAPIEYKPPRPLPPQNEPSETDCPSVTIQE